MSILTLEQWQQICQNTPKDDDSSATWEANPDPQVLVPQFDKSARSGRGDQAQDKHLYFVSWKNAVPFHSFSIFRSLCEREILHDYCKVWQHHVILPKGIEADLREMCQVPKHSWTSVHTPCDVVVLEGWPDT